MRRQTGDTIVCATIICCTITEIPPVVIVEATSSIENSRTARSDSRIRHKINPRRRLNKHKMARRCFDIASISNSQDDNVCSWTSEGMSRRTSYRNATITKIPGEGVGRSTTLDICYVERDRTTSTCSHRPDSNVGSGKRKVDHHSTRTDHQDMTGSRVNTSVIGSCQNYKIGSRPGIGMGGKSPIAAAIIRVRSTITKIPVVNVEV